MLHAERAGCSPTLLILQWTRGRIPSLAKRRCDLQLKSMIRVPKQGQFNSDSTDD
jgi:hypothetical protein